MGIIANAYNSSTPTIIIVPDFADIEDAMFSMFIVFSCVFISLMTYISTSFDFDLREGRFIVSLNVLRMILLDISASSLTATCCICVFPPSYNLSSIAFIF
jgi:hypothetical protein